MNVERCWLCAQGFIWMQYEHMNTGTGAKQSVFGTVNERKTDYISKLA